jgi:hypothetical protein
VLIANQAQVGFGAITDFHFGNGKIDGARITSLTAGQITSGTINSQYIQVGGLDGGVAGGGYLLLESRTGHRKLDYIDSNGVARVRIGRHGNTPNLPLDGLYVWDQNGKAILTANGLGVQVVGTDNITSGAVTTARFENSHTLGTNSIAGGNIHIVINMSANLGYNINNTNNTTTPVFESMNVRVVYNGVPEDPILMGGSGGSTATIPFTMLIAPAAGSPVAIQAQVLTGTGWQAFGSPVPVNMTNARCHISAIEYKR